MRDIAVSDLKRMQNEGEDFVLLDVREPNEVAYASIGPSLHIPMQQVPSRLNELDPAQSIVVFCHRGNRSLQICQFLGQYDFSDVMNLTGGIAAWSQEIDPSVPTY